MSNRTTLPEMDDLTIKFKVSSSFTDGVEYMNTTISNPSNRMNVNTDLVVLEIKHENLRKYERRTAIEEQIVIYRLDVYVGPDKFRTYYFIDELTMIEFIEKFIDKDIRNSYEGYYGYTN